MAQYPQWSGQQPRLPPPQPPPAPPHSQPQYAYQPVPYQYPAPQNAPPYASYPPAAQPYAPQQQQQQQYAPQYAPPPPQFAAMPVQHTATTNSHDSSMRSVEASPPQYAYQAAAPDIRARCAAPPHAFPSNSTMSAQSLGSVTNAPRQPPPPFAPPSGYATTRATAPVYDSAGAGAAVASPFAPPYSTRAQASAYDRCQPAPYGAAPTAYAPGAQYAATAPAVAAAGTAKKEGRVLDDEARKAFGTADRDRSGYIDFREFLETLRTLRLNVPYHDALNNFSKLDADKDGRIVETEFVNGYLKDRLGTDDKR